MRHFRIPRIAGIAATVAVGALALAGCSVQIGSGSSTPVPSESSSTRGTSSSTPSASASSQDAFSLSIGDCFNGTESGTLTNVPQVDCASPHDLEVYWDFDLTGSAFPGDTVVSDAARAGCQDQFAAFVGIDYTASTLDFTELTPTAASWSGGDRLVTCVVGDPNGTTTGTLAGAAR